MTPRRLAALWPLAFLPSCVCLALAQPISQLLGMNRCQQYSDDAAPITHYVYRESARTPEGTSVDGDVDLKLVDQKITEVGYCIGVPAISHCSIKVKIATDVYAGIDGVQRFNCGVPSGWCTGAIQPPNIIVVTPDLAALKHEVAHLVTKLGDSGKVLACE